MAWAHSKTIEWKDAAASVKGPIPTDEVTAPLTTEQEQKVLFAVLRTLHAQQAEKLIDQTYSRPGRDEKLMLLPDVGLRDAFGLSIGRIAHSHHWNGLDLIERLNSAVGSAPGFPAEWSIDEVKIACLLRCADAAHIDPPRADHAVCIEQTYRLFRTPLEFSEQIESSHETRREARLFFGSAV